MLLRSSEVRLLFIDLYQNSTQHSVVAVVPPTPTTPTTNHPLMMNRFLASVPSPPSHELRPQLWLSHCISRIPEFNPLVRVLSSGQLTIKLPRARRGVGPTLFHSPHFIHATPSTPFHSARLTDPPVPHLPFQLTLWLSSPFGRMHSVLVSTLD